MQIVCIVFGSRHEMPDAANLRRTCGLSKKGNGHPLTVPFIRLRERISYRNLPGYASVFSVDLSVALCEMLSLTSLGMAVFA